MRGSERFAERERESKPDNAVFEWLGARARARARAPNAVGVPGGMFSLIADSGVILFVSGVSNLIGLWLDYRCALAKMLLEVLDTEGCISCSRMSRPCHGCLDQGFDPFEGNGTTRYLGKP